MPSAKQQNILRHISRTTVMVQALKKAGIGLFLVLLSFGLILYTRAGGRMRAYAAVPSTMNFQARLLSSSGSIAQDGNYSIQFKLYTASTGGTAVWTETQPTVVIKAGYLSVSLGSVTALGSLDWSQQYYLTMNVNSDGEMSPRLQLTSVPYAFRSGQADTLTNGSGTLAASDLAQLAPSSVQVINNALAALRLNQTGAGLLAQWQGNGSDVFTVSKTGAVTAGTYNTNTLTSTALTFGGAGLATIQAANNQGLTVQSQGTGGLTLTSGSGTIVFGSNTAQNVSSGFTLDVNNAGLSTFNLVNNNGSNVANLDVEGGIFAGNGNSFSVNNDGDIVAAFTALNGTSTTNGAAIVASTSLILNDASNFDVGNYVQVNSTSCSGVGVNVCYAKITAKVTNTLTITPALTWANGATVNEYHIPEIGGIDTSQPLANRYGRGYFIAGVATGNGTTYYNENSIETSLTDFNLLNTGVTTLNIGGAATTINLGSGSTNVVLPGTLNIDGASLDIGSATQQGSLILQNGDSKTGTIQAGTLSANRTYTLPDASGTICLTTTCSGGGGGPVDAFIKDGNSFGVTAVLGTNDNYGLAFETNATQRVLIDAGGNVGIGTSGAPSQLLSIGGTTGNFTVSSAGALTAVGVTSSSGLTVTSGGASITGGLNNNGGGITSAGTITGVGSDITAVTGLTIASGGSGNLTLNSASGLAILGAGTLQTANNLLLDLSKATDTVLSLQNSGTGITNLNLVDGGLQTGGVLRLTNGGVLQNITGLTVSSGDANFNGNVIIGDAAGDRLTVTSQILGGSALVFQGATDNSFSTTLAVTDPTANNTITLPNASGTLVLDTRSINTAAGSGLSGGGNLSADRSLSLDINGITTKTNVNSNDYLAVYDATTSANRKISRSDFLQGLVGALQYRGTWNASTNTPTLADGTGTSGDLYIVSVAGSQNFGQGPSISFLVGDWALYNGSDWEKVDQSAKVTSIFGRTGAVVAQNGDYGASQITNVAAGNISATTVQAAINELDSEKMASLNGLTANSQTFANDTNVTITSSGSTHTLGWSGQLAVSRGGTGTNTFTTNGVLFGNGTSALQVTVAGTGGQILVADASGVPGFVSLSGDATVSATGVLTIGADKVALGTDTTGNYLASLGTLTGLTLGGTNGVEGGVPTLAVTYGSSANTAVQGNTSLTVTAGTNLGGGGTITLGAGGTVTLNTIANPVFTTVTASTLTSTAGLTISSGGTGDITLDSASNKIIIASTDTTLERTAGGSYTIDLKDNAATSLVLSNSNAGGSSVANLNLSDGELQIGGTSVLTSGRVLQNLAGFTNVGTFTTSGGAASINDASNFATNINTGSSTGTVTIGGGGAPLVIDSTNFDVSSAGALSGITTINTSGLITGVGFTAGSGLVQGTGGLTFTGAISLNNNASTNTTNIGTGTTSGQITIGGGSAPLVIDSTNFDVSSAGALSGITTITTSSTINTNTFTGTALTFGGASGTISTTSNGNLTLSPNGSGVLALNTGSGGTLTTNAATLQRTASGTTTFNLVDGANTTLAFTNSGAGNLNITTDGTVTVGTGLTVSSGGAAITGNSSVASGTFTSSGGLISLNASSNNNTSINTGTSTGTVTIGGGSAPLVIDSTNFDVSSAGALSGITTITTSSTINTNTFTGTALTFGGASGTISTTSNGNLTLSPNGSGVLALNTGSGGTLTTNAATLQRSASGTTTIDLLDTGANTTLSILNSNGARTANLNVEGVYQSNGTSGLATLSCTATQTANGINIRGGIVTAGTCSANLTDIAEQYDSIQQLEPGDVVVVDHDHYPNVLRSTSPAQQDLLGIVSTAPNQVLGGDNPGYPIALIGRVPTKVNLENGPIQPGDKLTSSSTPGVAMKATAKGPTLGLALEAFDGSQADGKIEVFVNLAWWDTNTSPAGSGQNPNQGDINATNIKTSGTIRIDETGHLRNINGLQLVSGGASVVGGISNNGGGITEVGAVSGVTSLDAASIRLTAAASGDLLALIKDGQGVFTIFNNGALELKLSANNALAIKDAEGRLMFTIDSQSGKVSLGSGDDTKTVLFTLDDRNLPDDPPGTNGSSYYNTVLERFRCYENNKWRDCLPVGDLTDPIALDQTSWALSSGDQEFSGMPRIVPNLTFAHEFRLRMRVTSIPAVGATCRLEYALSDDGPWKALSKDNTGELSINPAGTLKTDWLKIADEARKEDVIIRVMCKGGDGRFVTFYGVSMQLR